MSSLELRAAFGLALIFALRMAGLFLILPVFSLFARDLPEATPLLVGLAISIYGLTQAFLQIPFGILSDLLGRKKVITFGLSLFALGSIVAALAENIWTIIAGRALQGSGAVAAAIMALLADLTREEHRTKAMAIVGASIGLAFAFSMVAGPPLAHLLELSGLFWLIAVLALLGVLVLWLIIPTPRRYRHHCDTEPQLRRLGEVLRNRELLRLDFGIFALHSLLTANFVILPLVLRDLLGVPMLQHSFFYLTTMAASLFLMVPLVIVAEKRGYLKAVFLLAILLVGGSQPLWFFGHGHVWLFSLAMLLFFTGFNVLEALLPSLVSKMAPVDLKGTAMGVYSSSQFFGAFCGGTLGGWLHGAYGLSSVWLASAVLTLLWFLLALFMRRPPRTRTLLISLAGFSGERIGELSGRLSRLEGVLEVVVVPEEKTAYLKINPDRVDFDRLEELLDEEEQ